ncbi:MAG: N-acetylmuramoyl-L-alanine amidase [Clostridia bacterium]|nr:N-acetylmuramoyl-L-alanine amidase [Clostridia bacterium]
MLIFMKKWTFFALCILLFIGVFLAGFTLRKGLPVETAALPSYGIRVIVDAGHGEPDGGAAGKSGVLEKDLNLAVARFLQGYLEQGGAQVIMTRSDDSGIFDTDSKSIRNKKRSDLKNREKIMENSGADLFVSIHMNKFSDPKYSGPQVFYSKGHPLSESLAKLVQRELIAVLDPSMARAVKPAGKDIYLLSKASIPAVLVECGFLSNPAEEQLLLTEDYQKKTAWAIYCGILHYLSGK